MNQIFTEIIAKIKDIPLYEAILFLLYFSFSLQFNLFGIKYIITIIFLEFICCVCKNLFGNDLSHESSKEFGYQSTSVIVYEAFHSEQLNATLTTLVEKLFTTFFLYIALVFFSWQ